MSLQFKSTDSVQWAEGFGDGNDGNLIIAGATRADAFVSSNHGWTFATFTGTNTNTYGAYTDVHGFTGYDTVAGSIVMIIQTYGTGAGNWQFNVLTGTPSGGTVNFKYPLQMTFNSGAQIIKIPQWNNFTLNSGVNFYPIDWQYGGYWGGILPLFVKDTCTIAGNLIANGYGWTGGTGGNPFQRGDTGESYTGLIADQNAGPQGSSGGGGDWNTGNPYSLNGGSGGHNGAGTKGADGGGRTGGNGGNACGVQNCTTLFFGGAGGGGGGCSDNQYGGGGGRGGGIILIAAKNINVTTGNINVNGAVGGATNQGGGGGGGGGAGGSILLKAQNATVNNIWVSGGAGGPGQVTGQAPTGAPGFSHLDYSGSLTGSIDATLDPTVMERVKAGDYAYFM